MGFNKASVEVIAREANVSKSLVFWYFKSKKDLIKEIVEEILPRRIIESCLEKELKGEELLDCVIERYINLLSDDTNKKLAIHLMELSLTDPDYMKLYEEFCEMGLAQLAQGLFCREPGEKEMAAMRGLHGLLVCNITKGYSNKDVLRELASNMMKPLGVWG